MPASSRRSAGRPPKAVGHVLDVCIGSRALRRRAISSLRRGLVDAHPEVRFWCVYALGMMKAFDAREELERIAATDVALCPYMWRVCDEAADVLSYWERGKWPDHDFDPAARPPAT